MKISLALAVVLLAATPSLATFLRAAVGFRLGLGPHEFSRSYGWGQGRGVGGGIGGYKQIAIGAGGGKGGQGNILSHGASLKVSPLLPTLLGHGHNKGHGIRPLQLFGINLSLGGKGLRGGYGGGNKGWGWSGQQNQGGYSSGAPSSNYIGVNGGGAYAGSTGGYNTGSYSAGNGWGQSNGQNGGNLVGQYSEQGKSVAYGVKPQAAAPTEYYYPTQNVASSQLKAIEEKPQPQWHQAEKVKILYVPTQQNQEWTQQAQQSQVQPTAQQPLPNGNQQQYQYTASSNNVDSVSAASSQQVQQVVSRADGNQPWTPMFTPTMETSASEPVPSASETTVVKRQLEEEPQQMQIEETQENSSQTV